MKLLDSQVDLKMWNLVSKCNIFGLMANLKFSFSESWPRSVHIPPKPKFLFKFSNFWGYPPNHILSSNSARKIFKMAIKSKISIFYSQWDYQIVSISRILKFLTWHGFDEFAWNDPELKCFWRNYLFGPFGGQNVGPGCVKNGKKCCFHISWRSLIKP